MQSYDLSLERMIKPVTGPKRRPTAQWKDNIYRKITPLTMAPPKNRSKSVMRTVVFFAFVLICLLFYAWARLTVVHQNYDIQSLLKKEKELININSSLKLEMAALKSPDRLEHIAMTKYKLQYPASWQIVKIKGE